jgi:hypothetical protein
VGLVLGDKQQRIAPLELPKEELPSGFADLIGTLDQLLASKTFSRSAQLRSLLIYLREVAGSADPVVWSETRSRLQGINPGSNFRFADHPLTKL